MGEAVPAADWITAFFVQFLGALAPKKYKKDAKISDSVAQPLREAALQLT